MHVALQLMTMVFMCSTVLNAGDAEKKEKQQRDFVKSAIKDMGQHYPHKIDARRVFKNGCCSSELLSTYQARFLRSGEDDQRPVKAKERVPYRILNILRVDSNDSDVKRLVDQARLSEEDYQHVLLLRLKKKFPNKGDASDERLVLYDPQNRRFSHRQEVSSQEVARYNYELIWDSTIKFAANNETGEIETWSTQPKPASCLSKIFCCFTCCE